MSFVENFFKQSGFAEQDAQLVAASFEEKILQKGDWLVREGKRSTEIALLESGMLQYYAVSEKGEEQTTYITLPGGFAASLLSYLSEIPARENIRAISTSKIWLIQKSAVNQLRETIPAFAAFYVYLLEWQICCIDKGKFDLITLTAEERYAKLLAEEPELLRQVPLQYIASLMGITPRHLSRLRGKSV